ncbi:hypothetical protein BaRGS_00000429 [Batillaria attramentaria]|uniref:Uncharacterized protein n=1 Tax=Batillaria attramentaria TaxID=370345 RepID=A0ABD0M8B6_9CAEN
MEYPHGTFYGHDPPKSPFIQYEEARMRDTDGRLLPQADSGTGSENVATVTHSHFDCLIRPPLPLPCLTSGYASRINSNMYNSDQKRTV